jgi:hypothetical protein
MGLAWERPWDKQGQNDLLTLILKGTPLTKGKCQAGGPLDQ